MILKSEPRAPTSATPRTAPKAAHAQEPTIVVDSREQLPLPITALAVIRGTLQTGDYSVLGCEHLFAIERKTVADLVACCCGDNRERFERELHRLRGFRFKRLLIVGCPAEVETHRYRSEVSPKAVMGTLAAFECRYDLPIVWEPDATAAATLVCRWAWYFAREVRKTFEAMTPPQPESNPNTQDENAVSCAVGATGELLRAS